jgi:hypothetical protein
MPRRKKQSSEAAVRDIRRKTRRRFSAEEKIRIVLDGGLVVGVRVDRAARHNAQGAANPIRINVRRPSTAVSHFQRLTVRDRVAPGRQRAHSIRRPTRRSHKKAGV